MSCGATEEGGGVVVCRMLKSVTGVVCLLLLFTPESSSAQSESVVHYLPLEIGNSWTYIDILFPPPDFQPDTLWSGGTPLSEQVMHNDTLYYTFGFGPFGIDTVREDEKGNIWAFVESESFSVLMFDFFLEDGTIIEYGPDHPIFPDRVLTVSAGGALAGSLRPRGISFYYDRPGWTDSNWSYSFEAGVGITGYGGGIGEFQTLHTATIGGQVLITSVELTGQVSAPVTLENNFPNPFRTVTTIPFSVSRPSHIRLAVYDVLGREVLLLRDELVNQGVYTVEIDGSHLQSGTYFVHLQAGGKQMTRTIILVR